MFGDYVPLGPVEVVVGSAGHQPEDQQFTANSQMLQAQKTVGAVVGLPGHILGSRAHVAIGHFTGENVEIDDATPLEITIPLLVGPFHVHDPPFLYVLQ